MTDYIAPHKLDMKEEAIKLSVEVRALEKHMRTPAFQEHTLAERLHTMKKVVSMGQRLANYEYALKNLDVM